MLFFMQKVFIIGVLCFLSCQNKTNKSVVLMPPPPPVVESDSSDWEGALIDFDTPPMYKKGELAFQKYVEDNLKNPYPDINIEGTVWLSCVVETDGTLTNIRVRRGVGGGWNEEAIRVLNSTSGGWESGLSKGQKVKILYDIPIKCKIK
jgi:periplasmic protein TonB